MPRRFRGWKLRSLLIAIAVLALMLGWVRFEMRKPHPVDDFAGTYVFPIIWSDNGTHEDERGLGIYATDLQFGRLVTLVKWSDGSTTYYLHWPER